MSVVLISSLLSTNLNDVVWVECLVSGAALGIAKLQQFLERMGVRCVAKECAFAANLDQPFIFQLVEVM
jgi:hypothetical protein